MLLTDYKLQSKAVYLIYLLNPLLPGLFVALPTERWSENLFRV